jgi:hypothetical protein
MTRTLVLLGTLVSFGAALVAAAAGPQQAEAVAASETEYKLCGRVFPDPHAFWPAPTQTPARSPFAKGNAACASTDFVAFGDMVRGMTYMESLFPQFIEFHELEEDFGKGLDCATATYPDALCSAGLPRQGAPPGRVKSDLYMVRVTDERVPDAGKKYFAFPLAIHGIERAGAEAGVRAAEDLAVWAFCEAVKNGELPAGNVVSCANEGAIPHPLLETQGGESVTAGDALKRSVIYFIFPNPDGWRRGDPDNITRFYQRYNGNGVDLNRDWPTLGFTHRPYTPWSEPETRGFGRVLKQIKPRWDGGIDLHGQLIDRAFSFTLMGASERDYAKDQRILQTVKGAWRDAESRLAWSPHIKPNDAPATCVGSPVGGAVCDRMYGVQWGTVWDTINYTVTGALGDWIDSDLGLGADGIDNEMSFSHLINCGTGTCYEPVFEQMHVDGNKSLVYAMVNYTLLPEDTSFEAPGRIGYVFNPKVVSNPGNAGTPPPTQNLPPQEPIPGITLDPTNNYRVEFTVLGPEDGIYSGGVEGKLTQLNVGGIGAGSVASLVLERWGGEETPQDSGCGASGDGWHEMNRYFNQGSTYAQSGQAVHADSPEPGRWRICLTSGAQLSGSARLDIMFSTEKIWPNPGQRPYSVTNMKFFTDLAKYMAPGQLRQVNAADVLSGATDLDGYSSLVIADEAFPGVSAEQRAAWGAKLREFVEAGGNLVLTDGALQALPSLGIVAPTAVARSLFYAGYIGFTRDGGSTDTYGEELAANVDQPGAAEGSGHRHQTYEPVPIGMDIGSRTSCSGSTCTAPVWTVSQASWEAVAGRTVGTTGTNRASFGELKLGEGVVRIIGALLPMPTDQYYHPYGLANYAVTYSGYQVLKNTLQWNRPLPDVTLSSSDIAFSTQKVREGKSVVITATVHNVGTRPAAGTVVRFTDNGAQIGAVQTIASIEANGGTGVAQVVWPTKRLNGERTIAVVLDPADDIAEVEELNNTASRTVTVKGNKVKNSSFEESSTGSSPDNWSSSGQTSYANGGSDGQHSATAGPLGSWTSDPIDVEAGEAYTFSVDVAGAGSAVVVEQLSASGAVLSSATQLLSTVAGDALFHTVEGTLTAGIGVTQVRVKLTAGLTGQATFDDVGFWED